MSLNSYLSTYPESTVKTVNFFEKISTFVPYAIKHQPQSPLPASVALAYRCFAERYPQWVDALFDEHFLYGRVEMLTESVTAVEVAKAWVAQLGPLSPTCQQHYIDAITPAVTDFLNWMR